MSYFHGKCYREKQNPLLLKNVIEIAIKIKVFQILWLFLCMFQMFKIQKYFHFPNHMKKTIPTRNKSDMASFNCDQKCNFLL